MGVARGRPEIAEAAEAIMRAGLALRKLLHYGGSFEEACPHKLKPLAAWALFALGRLGPTRAGALAEELSLAPPNLRPLVSELEAEGLIETTRPEGDRRGLELSLSQKGRELLRRAKEAHVARLEAAFASLTAAELVELGKAAELVEKLLDKALCGALDK